MIGLFYEGYRLTGLVLVAVVGISVWRIQFTGEPHFEGEADGEQHEADDNR